MPPNPAPAPFHLTPSCTPYHHNSRSNDSLSQRSELAREKMWSRIYLTPLLQAEEDRDQARRYFADQAREKELFGTQTSAYNSDRYVSSSWPPWKEQIQK